MRRGYPALAGMNSRDASIPVIADAPDGSTGVGEVLVRAAISAADTA